MDISKIQGLVLNLQEDAIRLQTNIQNLSRELYANSSLESDPAYRSSQMTVAEGPRFWSLYELREGDYRFYKPLSLRMGDTLVTSIRIWKKVIVAVAKWIIAQSESIGENPNPVIYRKREKIPNHGGNSDSYIVKEGNYWIDTWGNVNTKVANLITLCTVAGVDPSAVTIALTRRHRP